MERNEFIKSLGLGVVLVCSGACMQGCGKKNDASPSNNGGNGGNGNNGGGNNGSTVSVDLSSKLQNVGDQTATNGVLFFRVAAGNTTSSFVATESICPHEGGELVWLQSQNLIQCQTHYSEYSTSGSVIQGPQGAAGSTRTLKIYPLTISGNTLTAKVS
ncbi:Rieske (2Fe-2S) protein [Pedobacter sp. BS3]|uniref:QcrA and Rieske domain-containing protein n=1 Tax=Pedobacter sp. BS3 TaxID=2567937 RepID=UPI0011EF259D|nr:Rieske (2Fe-2S) protein [Pedobacter sp. BS3]TZF82248.1 Rieske (2Fe-2S) protein [Pedobacter sp. BS3]